MEPLTIAAIASTLLLKAFEKSGEQLGEVTAAKIGLLLNIIQEKFKSEGIEGKLTKAQENPSEKQKIRLEQELLIQIADDATFAQKLQSLLEDLKLEQSMQIVLKGIDVKGDAKIVNIKQSIDSSSAGYQEAITSVKVGGNLEIDSLEQCNEGNH